MNFFYNILITGCSSGLGEALFNEVYSHDHLNPFAHYRLHRAPNDDPYALYGDINDFNFIDKLDEYIRTREIDCFINNAGVYDINVLETNLVSQVKMLQVVYDYFKEQKKGKIININPLAGINPTAGESLYCDSKFGLKFSQ